MTRSTRRSQAAAAAAEEEEDGDEAAEDLPQSPAQPAPIVDIAELKNDFIRFTFLQSVIQHDYMREDEAIDMYQQLTDQDSDEGYADFVASVNEPFSFLHLKLKRTKYNLDDEWYIAFVNELPDEPSQSATTLSIPQRAYFQSVLEAIATSDDCDDGKPWVGSTDAVNLNLTQASFSQAGAEESSSQAVNAYLTHAQKEQTLKQLVKEGWLAPTPERRGCYSIGVRTFLELGQYLTDLDLPETTRNIWKNFV